MTIGIFLGVITIIIAIVSYSIYLHDVFTGKTKPHGFSWFTWSILNSFIFYQQVVNGGGPGAWVTAVAALADAIIFLSAFKYGERNITKLDWTCLIVALIALAAWRLNSDPVLSVILASSVFVIGFIPTIRKSFKNARQETLATFSLNSLKFLIALFALDTVSITTALYPFVLFVTNGVFALFLFLRKVSTSKNAVSNRANRLV